MLARGGGAVLWSALRRSTQGVSDRLYVCSAPRHTAQLAFAHTGDVHPRVSQLKVAGHFVGFFLTTTEGVRETDLVVFNTSKGRVELTDYVKCSGGGECAGTPPMITYALVENGWVAELYGEYNAAFPDEADDVEALLATDGGQHHYPLDAGLAIADLSIVDGVLRWVSDLGGVSSVPLGPWLNSLGSPLSLPACQLLSWDDLRFVLGTLFTLVDTGRDSCERVSDQHPGRGLTLTLRTGLPPAQVTADEQSLIELGWGFVSWPDNDALQIYMNSAVVRGRPEQQLEAFARGSQLSLTLTTPSVNGDEQLVHVANVAFDRLFGVPVQRAS